MPTSASHLSFFFLLQPSSLLASTFKSLLRSTRCQGSRYTRTDTCITCQTTIKDRSGHCWSRCRRWRRGYADKKNPTVPKIGEGRRDAQLSWWVYCRLARVARCTLVSRSTVSVLASVSTVAAVVRARRRSPNMLLQTQTIACSSKKQRFSPRCFDYGEAKSGYQWTTECRIHRLKQMKFLRRVKESSGE